MPQRRRPHWRRALATAALLAGGVAAAEPSPSPKGGIDQVAAVDEIYKTVENKLDALLEGARSKKAALVSKTASDPKCIPRLKRPWHGPSIVAADGAFMGPFYAGVAQALLERGVITADWTPWGGAGSGGVAGVLTNAGYDGYAQLGLATQLTAALCPGGVCDLGTFPDVAMAIWGGALAENIGFTLGDRTRVWLSTWTGADPQYVGGAVPWNLTAFGSREDVALAMVGTSYLPCVMGGPYLTSPPSGVVGSAPSTRPVVGGRYSADFAELAYGLPGPFLTVASSFIGSARSFADGGASAFGGNCTFVTPPYEAPVTDLAVTPPPPPDLSSLPSSCAGFGPNTPPAVPQGSTLGALPDWEAADKAALANATGGKLGKTSGLPGAARDVGERLAAAKAGAVAGLASAAGQAEAWLLDAKAAHTPPGLGGTKGLPTNRSVGLPVDLAAVHEAAASARAAALDAGKGGGAGLKGGDLASLDPQTGLRTPSIYPGARTAVPYAACTWLAWASTVPPPLSELASIFKVGLREGQAWADEHGYCCGSGYGDAR